MPVEFLKIPRIEAILPHIPDSGIEEFELAAKLGISLPLLRQCLSQCPSVDCFESASVTPINTNPAQAHTFTVIRRVWRRIY